MEKIAADRRGSLAGLVDLLELGARALVGGIVAAVVLALAALVLADSAQAAPVGLNDAASGSLLLRTTVDGSYDAAPTVQTQVAIQVTGMIARTRVTQQFQNPGSEFVEGVYVFPLPEKAAVDHLSLRIGERTLEGAIQEKAEARRTFEQAKRAGRKAALTEQQRPNLFTTTVAHIGPGETVSVALEYQQSLAPDHGQYRLRFPLAVTPRYTPAAAASDGGELEPVQHPGYAAGGGAPVNPVDIAVVIDAGVALDQVASSYHDAYIEKQAGDRTVVYLAQEQVAADHDFELTWTLAAGSAPQAAIFTETVAGSDYALLMVVPPQPSAAESEDFQRLPRETILVVDTSGSMQGPSIAQAKAALGQALDSLTERDRFNVVEFNSDMHPLWPRALPATAANVRTARAWVNALQARGGTEMAGALTFALDGTEDPEFLRQVVFMTDGAVGNEDELFRLITQRLGSSRLFTVGIGAAPNSHFMAKAAQFGRGTFTYIGDTREVAEKMGALFAKIEAPVLRDVAIQWPDGTPVETFPRRVPDLYLGEPVMVSAAASTFAGPVIVSAKRGNQPWSVALTPQPAKGGVENGVGALWARAKIASLMDEMARGADAATVRPRVVEVALAHHLVSAYTSLVAVDTTPSAPGDEKSMLVKASLPRGYVDGQQIPQTDTPALLQFLLGLMALSAAAVVALIGRRAPRLA